MVVIDERRKCGNCRFSFLYETPEEPTRLGCAIEWTSVEKTFPNLTPMEAIELYGFPPAYVRTLLENIKSGVSICWQEKTTN